MTIRELRDELGTISERFTELAIALREREPKISFDVFRVSEICKLAEKELERMEPAEIELEGGGSTWWHVCGDCHGAIDERDLYCRHCGRKLKHDGYTEKNVPDHTERE